jgi:LacI family transcriptional regulator
MVKPTSTGIGAKRARPARMKDIAAAAGVAPSTVSRVLNDRNGPFSIPKETRERVLATAASLGYRPNPLARALAGAKTMLLGAVVRDITDPFFGRAIEELSNASIQRGYNVVLGHAHRQPAEILLLAALLEERHCDGIILLGDMSAHAKLMEDLQNAHVPVVALWQSTEVAGIPTVNVDDRLGLSLAVEHLCELGHRRIAFLGVRPPKENESRLVGFLDAMAARSLPVPSGYVYRGVNTLATGSAAFETMIREDPPPTAIVAATDVLALGALNAAWEHGLTVPSGFSVVGYDDLPMSAFSVPPLTTLVQPVPEMVEAALSLVLGEGVKRDPDRGAVTLPPRLVVRRSTSRPGYGPVGARH